MAKRIPNILKFRMVYSTMTKIEGTVKCCDKEFNSMLAILFPREGFDAGLEMAFRATPTAETVKGAGHG